MIILVKLKINFQLLNEKEILQNAIDDYILFPSTPIKLLLGCLNKNIHFFLFSQFTLMRKIKQLSFQELDS